jgi:cell pole-organizing protein PopZ
MSEEGQEKVKEEAKEETQEEVQEEASDETSMDDILANIRRVISEEDEDVAGEVAADPEVEVTEEKPKEGTEMAAGIETEELDSEINLSELESTSISEQIDVSKAPQQEASLSETDNVLELTEAMIAPADELMSGITTKTSSDVLSELARAIMDRREMGLGDKDVTLEGMVREMMRPLLREWLDRNLPYLIERLVKKEIDKMVNRAEMFDDL